VDTADLLRIALALPGVEQRSRDRGYLALEVAGRAFAQVPDGGDTVALKATRQEQAALVAADPTVYAASHVSGRFGWLVVRLRHADAGEVRELVTEAWRHTAPRRLVERHDQRA